MAVSVHLGVRFAGLLILRAIVLGIYLRALMFANYETLEDKFADATGAQRLLRTAGDLVTSST